MSANEIPAAQPRRKKPLGLKAHDGCVTVSKNESPRDRKGLGVREGEEFLHLPKSIHLLSMLIYECGNGIWRADVFAHPMMLIVTPLEFSCSGT